MVSRKLIAAALAAFAALGLLACAGLPDASPTTRGTAYGPVEGINDAATNGTYAWKGIPFAKAPVGALRWRAPAEPDSWAAPREAKRFGNACVQYGRIYGPGANNTYDTTIGTTLNQVVGHEDCLYLNIWRPASTEKNLPVLLFIHGGSNVSGYTADPVYDGAQLAKTANAVVVTANYRLGIFGWLNVPQLKAGKGSTDDSGNFATLDNIKALQFIHKNIGNFGGNAGNVTVMGQSAGAVNVYALLTSPLMVNANPKLFHKVVPMSGGLSLAAQLPPGSLPTLNTAAAAQAQGTALLNNLLIADGRASDIASAQAYVATQTPAQMADYLRAKDSTTLITILMSKLAATGQAGSGPIPEGSVVPTDPVGSINAGRYVKVPVLASNTRDEAKLFPQFLALSPALGGKSGRLVSDTTLFANHYSYQPDAAPTTTLEQWIPASYLPVGTPVTGYTAKTDLLNKIFFIASRDNILTALKAQQPSVWYYQFNWDKEPAPWNDIYGAAHAFDLAFVFGNFGPSLFGNVTNGSANRAGRLELSDAMMKSVAAFSRQGDPNNAALGVTWPAWPAKLMFDASLTSKAISVQ